MYKIELSEQDVNLVLQSLGEQKAALTMNVILNIKNQCAAQINEINQKKKQAETDKKEVK